MQEQRHNKADTTIYTIYHVLLASHFLILYYFPVTVLSFFLSLFLPSFLFSLYTLVLYSFYSLFFLLSLSLSIALLLSASSVANHLARVYPLFLFFSHTRPAIALTLGSSRNIFIGMVYIYLTRRKKRGAKNRWRASASRVCINTSDRERYQRSIQKQTAWKRERNNAELTLLSNRIGDYWYISQGKTRIPGVNDAADMEETDVSPTPGCAKKSRPTFHVAFHLFPLLLLLPFSPSPRESKAGDGKSWAEVFVTPSRPACESLPPPQSGCGEIGGGKESEGLDSRWEKIRTERSPHGTRSPISSDSLFLSRQHFSRLVLRTKYSFERNKNGSIHTIGICVYNDIEF